ncbi:hypothetical protein DXG01_003884 [Tephrocybe rancida]|nr:hypothetical protein DXG01_003884 [Tephrocybe rancida]
MSPQPAPYSMMPAPKILGHWLPNIFTIQDLQSLTAELATLGQDLDIFRETRARFDHHINQLLASDASLLDSEDEDEDEDFPPNVLPDIVPDFLARINRILHHSIDSVGVFEDEPDPSPSSDVETEGKDDVKGKGKAKPPRGKKRRLGDPDYEQPYPLFNRRLGWPPLSFDYDLAHARSLRPESSKRYFSGDPSGSWQRRRGDHNFLREDYDFHLHTEGFDSVKMTAHATMIYKREHNGDLGTLSHNPEQLVTPHHGPAVLSGQGSYIVLDFGQEVGGMLSLTVNKATPQSSLSLSFTESSEFISPLRSDDSCRTVPTMDADGVQMLPFPLPLGTFTQTIGEQRGGFRYLTIVSNSDSPVTISNVSVHTTWMPHWDDLRAYNGYFFAHDGTFHDPDFLTKLWYAGAYTVQTNTIDSHQARQPCRSLHGWANNATGGPVEGPILVDGAKRDRLPHSTWWLTAVATGTSGQVKRNIKSFVVKLTTAGDMGISSHTELVALNDLLPSKNSLLVMFSTQDPVTGSLQYSGPPINAKGSDTYIGWSLIGTHNYYLYTGDLDFVRLVWGNYTKALAFLEGQVDSTGLMNVPIAFSNDWGRDGGQGYNSAANAVLYQASVSRLSLITATDLATQLGDVELANAYSANATALKTAYNTLLWDDTAGMFRDNPTSTLHPQDGNALAVLFNVTNEQVQNAAISEGLTDFWTDIGPLSPELNDTIIPFVGGFEVAYKHISLPGKENGLWIFCIEAWGLINRTRTEIIYKWGYMLYTNLSVQSSLLEGFTRNGSLGYRAEAGYDLDHSYTSHSHGWATGPTPALTFFVLGLTLTSAQGATWNIAPVLSGLEAAEGGFETGLGWFGVKWSIRANVFNLELDVPKGTKGTVQLPGTGQVQVDGDVLASGARVMDVRGGKHTIQQIR